MSNSLPPSPLPPPPPSGAPPPPVPQFNKISLDLDPRTFATLKWSAIWNAVASIIESVAGATVVRNFPVGDVIREAVWGAIYGAVFGFLISKFYPQIQKWNRQYLKGRLNTFFKLLFYPSLIGSFIAFFLTSVAGFAVGFIGFVVSSYVYAKMMTKYVGSFYPPPV